MRLSLRLAIIAAVLLGSAGSAFAGGRTLRVRMYNSSTVQKSDCRVFLKNHGSKKIRLHETFTHTAPSGTKVYTTTIPTGWNLVEVSCRANGPRAKGTIDLNTESLSQRFIHSACASSQPDTKCSVYNYQGNP